jgi:death-on-curing protein
LGDRLKYPEPVSNAATLLYGICCDHPFHNGNKRTAVVAMLVHLDDNRLALYGTTQKELYGMVLAVAAHTIGVRQDPRRPGKTPPRPNSDQEVGAIASWIAERAARVRRGERQLTYRELRRILENFGFYLEDPDGNYIDVVRHEQRRTGFLRKRLETVRKRIGSIGWPGEHEVVGVAEIKKIRRLCELTEAQGVDSDSFYDRAAVIDVFVNQYRTLLRRLARR